MGEALSELKVGGLTLRGIACGGIETCLMVPELKLMFDIGRCPPGALRFGQILASHGHADHLGGLPYYVSQRRLMGLPPAQVRIPAEIAAPLAAIFAAWRTIEGSPLEVELLPTAPGDRFAIGKDLRVTALRTVHRVPSLAYVVERIHRPLRPEFAGRSSEALRDLRQRGVTITDETIEPLLCVTGDTQIELFLANPLVRRCRILVHEVTAWGERPGVEETRQRGHTHVDEMITHGERFEGEALVLVHRSPRHHVAMARALVDARFPAALRPRVHIFDDDQTRTRPRAAR